MNLRYSLILAAAGFAVYLGWRLYLALIRPHDDGEARRRYRELRAASRAEQNPKIKASLYLEAARCALSELERPNLAASLARRSERLDPTSEDALPLLVEAMLSAGRARALERQLLRRIDRLSADDARYIAAFDALLQLYEGPLRLPEKANLLRRLQQKE